jgi:hypothetical protein
VIVELHVYLGLRAGMAYSEFTRGDLRDRDALDLDRTDFPFSGIVHDGRTPASRPVGSTRPIVDAS